MATPPLPTPPATLADFKKRYARDFKYGKGTDTVMDADIQNAMIDAMAVFNPGLFSVADGWLGFLYLTAHFVRINVEAAGGLQAETEGLGIENQGEQVLASAGVAGINKGLADMPEWIKRIPLLQQLWITTYGQKYCAMVQPKLVGNVGAVSGPIPYGMGPLPPVPFVND